MQNAYDYFKQLFSEAGLNDAEFTAALDKIAKHEKLAPKLDALVKTATEDYNAQLGRVRAAEEKVSKYDKWYPDASAQYAAAMAELAELKAKLNGGTGGAGADEDTSQLLAKAQDAWRKDLQATVTDMAGRYAASIKIATRLGSRHAARYGEELDVDAIEKIAEEQKIPLDVAYDRFVEPRVKEQKQKDDEQWKKETREEIERDVRSRMNLPVDPTPPERSPIFVRPAKADQPADIDADLLSAWHGVKK